MTGPPTVPGWDLNPGPLSFEASALLTELTRPDKTRQDQTRPHKTTQDHTRPYKTTQNHTRSYKTTQDHKTSRIQGWNQETNEMIFSHYRDNNTITYIYVTITYTHIICVGKYAINELLLIIDCVMHMSEGINCVMCMFSQTTFVAIQYYSWIAILRPIMQCCYVVLQPDFFSIISYLCISLVYYII